MGGRWDAEGEGEAFAGSGVVESVAERVVSRRNDMLWERFLTLMACPMVGRLLLGTRRLRRHSLPP